MNSKSADIRWIQRFENICKALGQLSKFIEKKELSELEEQGLIQVVEYTYELAWNTIKDFYEHQGETGIQGSRDAIRLAFRRRLIENGDAWMRMIQSRALTSHTYNKEKLTYFATPCDASKQYEDGRSHKKTFPGWTPGKWMRLSG
jgi:nucleotidyltransferase substrate binding protein (TIGR01987 family)